MSVSEIMRERRKQRKEEGESEGESEGEGDGSRNRGGGERERERERRVTKSIIITLFILVHVDFLSLCINRVCLFRPLLYTRN